MKTLSLIFCIAVVLLTVIAVSSVTEGAQAAVILASGFVCLLLTLAFYVLCDIREVLKPRSTPAKQDSGYWPTDRAA